MRQHIVFDFDGVLADSFDVFIDSLMDVQPKYFAKRSKDILENISRNIGIGSLGVSEDKLKGFTESLRDCYIARSKSIKLYHGVKNILEEMKGAGLSLGIVSSNSFNLLVDILDRNDVSSYFEFVVGDIILNGKNESLSSLHERKVDKERSWYVGDTPSDIKSAKYASMLSAAACWGYSSEALLRNESPDCYFHDPSHLLGLIDILM